MNKKSKYEHKLPKNMNREYELMIPLDPSNLGGDFSLVKAEVFASKNG